VAKLLIFLTSSGLSHCFGKSVSLHVFCPRHGDNELTPIFRWIIEC